jgi:transposase
VKPDTLRLVQAGRRGRGPGEGGHDRQRDQDPPLEREVRELKRANEILLAASSFFARELDPRLPW